MGFWRAALHWLADPANAIGPDGYLLRFVEHLGYCLLAVHIACLIGIPIGYLVGHSRRARGLVVISSGAARALPTLGVITLLGLWLGIGLEAPLLALVLLAVPSVLAGAYAGIEQVPAPVVDAARAIGMSPWQVLWQVEAPVGLPLPLGGIRSAMLQVVATATLAAYVGAGGLGRYLFLGLKTQNYPMMLAASLLVVLLAMIVEFGFEWVMNLAARRNTGRSRRVSTQ